jgi:hypothetical protein
VTQKKPSVGKTPSPNIEGQFILVGAHCSLCFHLSNGTSLYRHHEASRVDSLSGPTNPLELRYIGHARLNGICTTLCIMAEKKRSRKNTQYKEEEKKSKVEPSSLKPVSRYVFLTLPNARYEELHTRMSHIYRHHEAIRVGSSWFPTF